MGWGVGVELWQLPGCKTGERELFAIGKDGVRGKGQVDIPQRQKNNLKKDALEMVLAISRRESLRLSPSLVSTFPVCLYGKQIVLHEKKLQGVAFPQGRC